MEEGKLILDYVYAHELARSDKVFLTQPVGAGQLKDYSWAQTMDQARRMATHIKSLGLEPGARIAILSKNCAHFFIAELAIWLAGCTYALRWLAERQAGTEQWPRRQARRDLPRPRGGARTGTR